MTVQDAIDAGYTRCYNQYVTVGTTVTLWRGDLDQQRVTITTPAEFNAVRAIVRETFWSAMLRAHCATVIAEQMLSLRERALEEERARRA